MQVALIDEPPFRNRLQARFREGSVHGGFDIKLVAKVAASRQHSLALRRSGRAGHASQFMLSCVDSLGFEFKDARVKIPQRRHHGALNWSMGVGALYQRR